MYDAKTRKMLQEMFGEPLSPEEDWHQKMTMYKGDAPSGAPGVNPAVEVCPGCGMMRIEGKCGCDETGVCPECGMMHVDGACGYGMLEADSKMCNQCGMSQGCGCTHLEEDSELSEGKGGSHSKSANKKRAKTIAKKYGKKRRTQVAHGVYDWAKAPFAAAQANLMALKGK